MIEAEVHQNDRLIMQRTFYEPSFSLQGVMDGMEMYIQKEMINTNGECLVRVRFSRLQK